MEKKLKPGEFGPPLIFESYKKFFLRKFGENFKWGMGCSLFLTSQISLLNYLIKYKMVFEPKIIVSPLIMSVFISIGFGLFGAVFSPHRKVPPSLLPKKQINSEKKE
ncbi:unnamed protein product [Moneuplotes crassus]|uniref:Uncharacterized protein n=1 Tax=Euplotes crassus TaxID=5936 RepID=A0AAD2D9P0_EUPCR|nr:unnamed protein product [Moneuplotes crassus]